MNPDLNNLSLAELQERVNASCPLSADATAPNTLSYWFQIGKAYARWEQSQLRRKVLFGWGGKAKPLLAVANRIEASEAEIIERSLRQHNYNQRATARTLKINRCTLIRRIKKYGIVMPLLLVLVSGCKTSSSVTPSETPVAVSRKPISGGIPPLLAASLQKRVAAAVIGPPAKPLVLTWDMPPGAQVTRLESSTDLKHWQPLAALTNVNHYELAADQVQLFIRQAFPDEYPWHWWDNWNAGFRTE